MSFRLKDFRQAHKLYQSEMAELLQTNQSTISRMELRNKAKLSYPQIQTLIGKYGQEDVQAFMEDDPISIVASGNTNEGDGTQNNGCINLDDTAMAIIRQQSESLAKLAAKQAEQTDKLLVLLDKLSDKL